MFQRYFNLVAHSSATSVKAQQEMCVLMPEVAIIEEAILLLNPIYGSYVEAAERLLFRMGFTVLRHRQITFTELEAQGLFK